MLSSSGRLDDAVGKYTFYLARVLEGVSNSKVEVVVAGRMSSWSSAETVRVAHSEPLARRTGRWVIDRLPKSFGDSMRFRFRGWGVQSVKSIAEKISSADLVWDIFASSSSVHHVPREIRGQALPTFVLDYHGITSPELVDPPFSQALHESIEELKMCAPTFDHYVVHSKFMAEELATRIGITRNVDVIGLFCDPELLRNRKVSKQSVSDRFVILFVGRISKHKGLDVLIRALKIVRDRGLNANVILVGKQIPYDVTVQQINHLATGLGIREYLSWLGNVNTTTLQEAYCGADVLVLPSRHEGFGLPTVEAMWFDLPVIVSNSGALPEVVGDGALVFKTDDYADLAEKIIMLHENLEIRNRILRAAQNVRELYTIEKFAGSIREVCARYLA